AEAKPRERVSRGDADHERDQGRDPGDDDRVLDECEVVVLVDDLAVVVLDRGPVEMERRRDLEERLQLRLAREHEQVEERRRADDRDQDQDDVRDDPPGRATGDHAVSSRRTLTTLKSSVIPTAAAITMT